MLLPRSSPAGSASYLHYADRVARLLPGIVGAATATVLLPLLSRRQRGGSEATAADATNRTIEAVLVLGVPGAAALAVIAEPATAALFQRGAFTAAATAAAAPALAAYAAAVPAWILIRTLGAVFFARGDTATPMAAAAAAVLVNLAFGLLLMGPFSHVGIALATALAAWIHALSMYAVLMRRSWFEPDARLRRSVPAVILLSLATAGVLWLTRLALGGEPAAGELQRVCHARSAPCHRVRLPCSHRIDHPYCAHSRPRPGVAFRFGRLSADDLRCRVRHAKAAGLGDLDDD